MEKEFNKIAKLVIISTIVIILTVSFTGVSLMHDIMDVKKEVTKLKEKYKKNVVAFGDGWEIRLDNTIDYKSNCDELMQAFIAIYGHILAKDSVIKNQ